LSAVEHGRNKLGEDVPLAIRCESDKSMECPNKKADSQQGRKG